MILPNDGVSSPILKDCLFHKWKHILDLGIRNLLISNLICINYQAFHYFENNSSEQCLKKKNKNLPYYSLIEDY